jgi:hypothetical protein
MADEMVSVTTDPVGAMGRELRSKSDWKRLGFQVPTKAQPTAKEQYLVPGYRTIYRTRYLYSRAQVVPIDPIQAEKRSQAAAKAVVTRIHRMEEAMKNAELTIVRGYTNRQIYDLALATHGGNYAGDPGEFIWCNSKARNAIRHCLTNYEKLWSKINRGKTAQEAYDILRERVDELVDEAYPQFAEDEPEVNAFS